MNMNIKYIKYIYSLYEPCLKGSKYWINYFIKKGANNWNGGLSGACRGNRLDIIDIMLQKGANYELIKNTKTAIIQISI